MAAILDFAHKAIQYNDKILSGHTTTSGIHENSSLSKIISIHCLTVHNCDNFELYAQFNG